MKAYELTLIISPNLTEIELKEVLEKVKSFLSEEGGLLSGAEEQIKRKEKGFLSSIDFSINPANLKNLEKKLKSENKIIRYIIISQKTSKKESGERKKPVWHPEKRTKKVELKEIDEKIDEIINE